ncbi:MAG: PEP-CTERM sorting domain-containing protein [Candidatus Auribacterota bacterium]
MINREGTAKLNTTIITTVKTSFILCIILLCTASGIAYDITWNYHSRTTWGDGVKPDGDEYGNTNVWSYLKAPVGSSNSTLYSGELLWMTGTVAGSIWALGPNYPAGGTDWFMVSQHGTHPSAAFDPVIAFIAPLAGIYDISVTGTATNGEAHPNSDGQMFYLQKGSSILSSASNPSSGTTTVSASDVALNAGESLYFRLNMKTIDWFDSVALNSFTVTGTFPDPPAAVPEPSTILIFGTSLIALLKRRLFSR